MKEVGKNVQASVFGEGTLSASVKIVNVNSVGLSKSVRTDLPYRHQPTCREMCVYDVSLGHLMSFLKLEIAGMFVTGGLVNYIVVFSFNRKRGC